MRTLLGVSLALALVATTAASMTITTKPFPNSWMRGTDTFALDADAFVANGAFERLKAAKAAWPGLTHVVVQWMWHMDSGTANKVSIKPDESPSMENITAFVREAHSIGLRTLLKPLVVSHHIQMPELNPSDPAEWFTSYGALMSQVYDIAYAENVDAVSVGLELFMIVQNPQNVPLWRALIADGRRRCPSCRLTYCSNPMMDEQTLIPFWTDLDFIGMDLYIPYVFDRAPNATVVLPDIATMSSRYDFALNKHVLSWYRNFSADVVATGGNPPKMIVTECGYPSNNQGMQSPWLLPKSCAPAPTGNASDAFSNFTAQQVAYEVMFDRLTQPGVVDVFAGFVNFWVPLPGGPDYFPDRNESTSVWACSYATLDKPAGDVIATAFSRS